MAKRCLIETCKREAETYCYHCSHDVCTKHYLEHKKSIQEQLHPLVDEINLLYDHLRHDERTPAPQYLINACSQLDRWRDECYQRINTAYDRVRNQIDGIVEGHKHDEEQKKSEKFAILAENAGTIEGVIARWRCDAQTTGNNKATARRNKKKEQEPVKCPDVRIVTQKIDVDKYVNVTTDVKLPNEKQQQARNTEKMPPNKSSIVQHRFSRWSSSGPTAEKCPMCSEVFPLSMTMTDRTVHINEHLPD